LRVDKSREESVLSMGGAQGKVNIVGRAIAIQYIAGEGQRLGREGLGRKKETLVIRGRDPVPAFAFRQGKDYRVLQKGQGG